jgi:GNAT superfamily N-acetyltransferase
VTPTLIEEIEARAYAAWPAATEYRQDDWVLRTAGGFSRRLNSVQAVDDVDAFDASLQRAAAFYQERGLPLVFRVTPLCAATDPLLEARGFTTEAPTDVMVADLVDPVPIESVVVASEPSRAWIEAQQEWLGITKTGAWQGILNRSAGGAGATGFGMMLEAGAPVAAGLAVADAGWVGLFEITVDPEHRHRGLGRIITRGLLGWGRRVGVRRSYLQVPQSGSAARRLYDSLGFVALYSYWYRRAPTTR